MRSPGIEPGSITWQATIITTRPRTLRCSRSWFVSTHGIEPTLHAATKGSPHNRIRTSDLDISVVAIYSLPLYQLSYARTSCFTSFKTISVPGWTLHYSHARHWCTHTHTHTHHTHNTHNTHNAHNTHTLRCSDGVCVYVPRF